MAKTIGIIAIKGGVGKTSVSASLAADLANRHKKKVLLIDANYSAPNLGLHMDIVEPVKTIHDVLAGKAQIEHAVHNRYGVDVIPGSFVYNKSINHFKLRGRIDKIKDNYDFVIIDSSPSMNNEILSAMMASDNLFVVTTPDYPTLSCSLKAAKLAKEKGVPILGIIINKIRKPKYELDLSEIENATGIPVVAKIKDDSTHLESIFTRMPATIYKKSSTFSREIAKLSDALAGKNAKLSFWRRLFSFNIGKEEINRQVLRQSFYKSMFED
ncbi:MAG: AAA family ATPase [Candidatus Pacearchaeota archaeon]